MKTGFLALLCLSLVSSARKHTTRTRTRTRTQSRTHATRNTQHATRAQSVRMPDKGESKKERDIRGIDARG
jgi:hypothetical protein